MTAPVSTRVAWHRDRMVGFDLETTGVDVETDRIVTSAIVLIAGGNASTMNRLVNPGVPIPAGAAAIHGITTEKAAAEGDDPKAVLEEVVQYLADAFADGCPVVGMNLAYDLTLLDRVCRRHDVEPLSDRVYVRPVVDVRVLDKAVDPYRRGGRKLTDLCEHYGVRIDGAHDAGFDAIAACRVAWKLAEQHPAAVQIDLGDLHERQIRWAAEQTASFAEYRRRIGDPLQDEDGTWPIRPRRSS